MPIINSTQSAPRSPAAMCSHQQRRTSATVSISSNPGVIPLPQSDETRVIAQVLWVDRFGNAQLNVGPDDIPASFGDRIDVRFSAPTDPSGGTTRNCVRATSFAELAGGAVGLVHDSSGMLAVAMDQRSAAEELGLDVGDQVTLTESSDAGDGRGSGPVTQQVSIRPS
jgi:S-adenosylmethionine hydrolase